MVELQGRRVPVYNRAAPMQNRARAQACAHGIYIFSPDGYKLIGRQINYNAIELLPQLSIHPVSGAPSNCVAPCVHQQLRCFERTSGQAVLSPRTENAFPARGLIIFFGRTQCEINR
jgi:hypothetical protein